MRDRLKSELGTHWLWLHHPILDPDAFRTSYDVRLVPRYIGTRGRARRAGWTQKALTDEKPPQAAFISLHCNAGAVNCTTSRYTEAFYRPDIVDSTAMAATLIGNLGILCLPWSRQCSTEDAT